MSSAALKKLASIAEELEATTPMAVEPRVAVLLPCLNEAAAIGKVVAAFKASLPDRKSVV